MNINVNLNTGAKIMYVTTDYPHATNFTAGKQYEVVEDYCGLTELKRVIDDNGHSTVIKLIDCAFLDGVGNWEIVEEVA